MSGRIAGRRRKPFIASGEFWLGLFSALVALGMVVGFLP